MTTERPAGARAPTVAPTSLAGSRFDRLFPSHRFALEQRHRHGKRRDGDEPKTTCSEQFPELLFASLLSTERDEHREIAGPSEIRIVARLNHVIDGQEAAGSVHSAATISEDPHAVL